VISDMYEYTLKT